MLHHAAVMEWLLGSAQGAARRSCGPRYDPIALRPPWLTAVPGSRARDSEILCQPSSHLGRAVARARRREARNASGLLLRLRNPALARLPQLEMRLLPCFPALLALAAALPPGAALVRRCCRCHCGIMQ